MDIAFSTRSVSKQSLVRATVSFTLLFQNFGKKYKDFLFQAMFYVLAGIWGLAEGASIGNLLGVLGEFCHVNQLAILFGLHLFTEGVGALAGTPLCSK